MIKDRKVKIVKAASNNQAAKVYFASEKEKDEVLEMKERLRSEEDCYVDRWLTIEERKKRCKLTERERAVCKKNIKEKVSDLSPRLKKDARRRKIGERCAKKKGMKKEIE